MFVLGSGLKRVFSKDLVWLFQWIWIRSFGTIGLDNVKMGQKLRSG